jgi:ankyrin repeat protein
MGRAAAGMLLIAAFSAGARMTAANYKAAVPQDRPTAEQRFVTATCNGRLAAMSLAWDECRCDADRAAIDLDIALRVAILHGDDQAISLLIGLGADVNHPDSHGTTPLILTVGALNAATTAQRLLVAGADPAAVDEDGQSPLTMALHHHDDATAELLSGLVD